MTISNTDRSVTATGNGATTAWPYTFKIPTAAGVNVVTTVVATGVQTVIDAADYTITGLGDANGGEVTYPTVASGNPALTSAVKITIYRTVPQTQLATVSNQTRYDASVVEAVWDLLTMMIQDIEGDAGLNIRYPSGDTATSILPAVTPRANKVIAFDASGNVTVSTSTISSLESGATDAAASAVAASTSETNAATSETNAATSETNAGTSETNAATSASVAQAAAAGIKWKAPCMVATQANIILSGEQTIDGVLTTLDRVLVKDQTAPAENGIYVSAVGAWARADDMNAWDEVPNTVSAVEQGTVSADKVYMVTANEGGTLGTTAITFTVFGTGDMLASNNLSDVTVAATARTNLGVAIGTDVQAYDSNAAARNKNAQTGIAYTLVLTDGGGSDNAGKLITMSNAAANVVTIPPNSSVAFPVGTQIDILMKGAGITSITGGTGVTLNGILTGTGAINGQYQAVTIIKDATNTWFMVGAHGTVA